MAARGAAHDPGATLAATSEQAAATRASAASWAKTAIHHLWAAVDPYSDAQVKAFAQQAALLMESAQTAVSRVAAAGTQQSLASLGVTVDSAPSNPLNVRAPAAAVRKGLLVLQRHTVSVDYAGVDAAARVSRADMTTEGIFGRPGALYRWVTSQGKPDAAGLAAARIDNLIDTNLMLAQRLASQEMLVRAANLDDTGTRSRGRRGVKVIGYRRVIHPELSRGGTCGMCIAASDRIYHVAELMPIHGGCHCTVAPVTEDHDPADDLNAIDLNALYKQAGGTSAAHLKRTRYKVDEHGELGAVLVPGKKYNPRSAVGDRAAAATAPSAPESPADIARRHLPILEQNLANLRAAGADESSPPVQYHLAQIERMRADLSTGPNGPTRESSAARSGKGMRTKNTPEAASSSNKGGGGGEPPRRPPRQQPASGDNPEDRMSTLFAGQAQGASAGHKASAARWQSLDRFYQHVQAAVADEKATDEALQVMADLQSVAIPLPEDVEVWRGIRSINNTFGAGLDELEGREPQIVSRFLSTTVHESVARDEFTRPGENAALLKVTARAGAGAVWMPPIGDPAMAYQGELLFLPGSLLRIVGVDTSSGVPVIEVEVSQP